MTTNSDSSKSSEKGIFSSVQIKATGLYSIIGFLPFFSSFLLLPINTRFLTPADFGIVTLANVTRLYLAVLIICGFDAVVSRFYWDHYKNKQDLRKFLAQIVTTILIFTGIAAITLWLWGPAIFTFAWGDGLPFDRYGWLILLSALFDAANLATFQYFRIAQKLRPFAFLSIAFFLSSVTGGIIGVAVLELGALGNIAGKCLGAAVLCVPYYLVLIKTTGLRLNIPYLGTLLRYSLPVLLYSLIANSVNVIDKIVVNAKFSTADLGIYNVAFVVAAAVSILASGSWHAVLPEIFKTLTKGGPDCRAHVNKLFFALFFATYIAIWGLIALVDPTIRILTDSSYHAAMALIPVLAFAHFGRVLSWISTIDFLYNKKTIAMPIINVLCLFILIITLDLFSDHLSLMGIALALICGHFSFYFVATLASYRFGTKEIPLLLSFRHFYLPIIASGGLLFCNYSYIYERWGSALVNFIEGSTMILLMLIGHRKRILDIVMSYKREKAGV